ncbi:MAG: Asr1405/Asl0597 family protein [Prochlorothrix sp.]
MDSIELELMERSASLSRYNREIQGDIITQWRIYRCLQNLEIPCQYSSTGVVQVQIRNAQDDRRLQQIINQVAAYHPDKAQLLETCFNTVNPH